MVKVRLMASTVREIETAIAQLDAICSFKDIRAGRDGDFLCYGEVHSRTLKPTAGMAEKSSSRSPRAPRHGKVRSARTSTGRA
jgi:hypothetical protein